VSEEKVLLGRFLNPIAAATGAELSLTDPIHATMISGIGG
jgi:hypothetical protein